MSVAFVNEIVIQRQGAKFTKEEDDYIVQMRERGYTFSRIAERIGRTEHSVRAHFYVVTGRKSERDRANYQRRPYRRLKTFAHNPLLDEMLPPDDADYVAACVAAGGFTRENFWRLQP